MSDWVVDSSVVAKWIITEPDSAKADDLLREAVVAGSRLIVLDIVFAEVANAIWKRHHRRQITAAESKAFLEKLQRAPVTREPTWPLLTGGLEIAVRYDRAVYDALFIALMQKEGIRGVTADEPLFNAVHRDFPQLMLLKDL